MTRYIALIDNFLDTPLKAGDTFLLDGIRIRPDNPIYSRHLYTCSNPARANASHEIAVAPACVSALVENFAVLLGDVPEEDRELFALACEALGQHWGSVPEADGWINIGRNSVRGRFAHGTFALRWKVALSNRPQATWNPCAPETTETPETKETPVPRKPEHLVLIHARTPEEANSLPAQMLASGWSYAVRSDSVPSDLSDRHLPLLLVGDPQTKTFIWWTLGSSPSGHCAVIYPDTLPNITLVGAVGARKKLALLPKEQRITLAWLKRQEACAPGQKWFGQTFGPEASVDRGVVLQALKAENLSSWADWLNER